MEVLTQISVLIGIWVAIYGIDAWRREHVGKRQIELAEETLALFYEAVDAVKHLRHPASFGAEIDDIKRVAGESEKAFDARKHASVVFYRHKQYQQLFSKLHATRYRFMAQFGKAATKPFDELHSIVGEIIMSARLLSRYWAVDTFQSEEHRNKHWERIEKQEAVFWEGIDNDDPINPRMDELVDCVERTCRQAIEGQKSLPAILSSRLRIGS
jgi:hypothetical protein